MFKRFNKVGYVKLLTDFVIITVVFLLASYLSNRGMERIDRFILVSYLVAWYFSSKVTNAYDDFRTETFVGELLILLQNIVVQLIVAGQLYFMLNEHAYARTFVAWYIGLLTVVLIIKGYFTKQALLLYRKRGGNIRSVVFIGFNDITANLIDRIRQNPHFGYKVIGVVSREEVEDQQYNYLGDLQKFFQHYRDLAIDDIIITTSRMNQEMMNRIFLFAENKAIRTKVIPNYNDLTHKQYNLQIFGGYPMIAMRGEPLQEFHWRGLKRLHDIVFSMLAILLVFSWLFPIIAFLIKIDSKGPVFFKQDRWGENGKRFKMWKFRSMKPESSDVTQDGRFNQAKNGDPRITKLGAFLRKSSLDELPQFFNVLLGDMSVVGPRPHAHEHNMRTKDEIDKYMIRHWVKPGVTGWAQVNGYRGETKTKDAMQKRVDLDIWYIENWNFWLDIKIVLMTIYNGMKGEENAY